MWPFRRKKPDAAQEPREEAREPEAAQEPKERASFGADLEDGAVFRHHAVRALCGVLMDRHTACRSPHPFCGIRGHRKNGDAPEFLIAFAIPQRSPASTELADLIGIYLCRATGGEATEDGEDIRTCITRMVPADPVSLRKVVVSAPQNGIYPVAFGPILNPVEGDYSTGSIDPNNVRPLNSNPEPRHCRWQYWDSSLPFKSSSGGWLVPRFHCMQVFGEWWIVEMQSELSQQVAALDFADNPEHNFGIHTRDVNAYVLSGRDESEVAKTIRENFPRNEVEVDPINRTGG